MEVDARWIHPGSSFIVGATGTGKTHILNNIIQDKDYLFKSASNKRIKNIILCYSAWQDVYSQWQNQGILTKTIEGFPSMDTLQENFIKNKLNGGSILILDDLVPVMALNDIQKLLLLLTVSSHHYNVSIIFVGHNLFHRNMRECSLQYQRYILTNNFRDKSQIITLGRQIYPTNINFLCDVYSDVLKTEYNNLILDLSPNQSENMRVTSGWFKSDPIVSYKESREINNRNIFIMDNKRYIKSYIISEPTLQKIANCKCESSSIHEDMSTPYPSLTNNISANNTSERNEISPPHQAPATTINLNIPSNNPVNNEDPTLSISNEITQTPGPPAPPPDPPGPPGPPAPHPHAPSQSQTPSPPAPPAPPGPPGPPGPPAPHPHAPSQSQSPMSISAAPSFEIPNVSDKPIAHSTPRNSSPALPTPNLWGGEPLAQSTPRNSPTPLAGIQRLTTSKITDEKFKIPNEKIKIENKKINEIFKPSPISHHISSDTDTTFQPTFEPSSLTSSSSSDSSHLRTPSSYSSSSFSSNYRPLATQPSSSSSSSFLSNYGLQAPPPSSSSPPSSSTSTTSSSPSSQSSRILKKRKKQSTSILGLKTHKKFKNLNHTSSNLISNKGLKRKDTKEHLAPYTKAWKISHRQSGQFKRKNVADASPYNKIQKTSNQQTNGGHPQLPNIEYDASGELQRKSKKNKIKKPSYMILKPKFNSWNLDKKL